MRSSIFWFFEKQDGKKDEYIIGVIGPALIENATIEEEMDGYVSWRGGVVDNGNGTYTVNYKIDHTKGVAAHNGATIDMYIKIDDGTMFSTGTMESYNHIGDSLRDGLIPNSDEQWDGEVTEKIELDEYGDPIESEEEVDEEGYIIEGLPEGWEAKTDEEGNEYSVSISKRTLFRKM